MVPEVQEPRLSDVEELDNARPNPAAVRVVWCDSDSEGRTPQPKTNLRDVTIDKVKGLDKGTEEVTSPSELSRGRDPKAQTDLVAREDELQRLIEAGEPETRPLVAARDTVQTGAGSSAPKESLRSPEWLKDMERRLERDKAAWAESRAQEAKRRAELQEMSSRFISKPGPEPSINLIGRESKNPFRLYRTSSLGSPGYRDGDVSQIPAIPKVLVPDTPESTPKSDRLVPLKVQTVPEVKSKADKHETIQKLPEQAEGRSFWNSLQDTIKPVSAWWNEVSESMTRPAEMAEQPPVVPAARAGQPAKPMKANLKADLTEYEDDEEVETFIRGYITPDDKKVEPVMKPKGNESIETNMEGRIPTKDKGKGRVVRFHENAVAGPSRTQPVLELAYGSDDIEFQNALKEIDQRERELLVQMEHEKAAYLRLQNKSEEIALKIALKESAAEAQRMVEKQERLESDLQELQKRIDKPRIGKAVSPAKIRPSLRREAERAADRKGEGLSKEAGDLIQRITAFAKAQVAEQTQAEQRKESAEPTASTLKESREGSIKRRYKREENDSPSSLSSSDESESSDSSKDTPPKAGRVNEYHRKRKKRQRSEKSDRKAALKAMKIQKPPTYNGETIYEKYETWVKKMKEWKILHDLSDYATLIAMGVVVEGKARKWFDSYVRGDEAAWTLEEISREMFHGIFPDNYASILRQTYEDARQRENSLKEWHEYFEKLASRVEFTDEHEMRRLFWKGSATYLQEEWAKIGLRWEDPATTIEKMMECGKRFERARGYHLAQEKKSSFNTRGLRGSSSKPRPSEYLYKDENQFDHPEESQESDNSSSTSPANHKQDKKLSAGGRENKRKRLTRDEKEQLRAEGRCFTCKKQGHVSQNCPERREGTPSSKKDDQREPYIYNGSMQFEIPKAMRAVPTLRLNMMQLDSESEGIVLESELEDEGAITDNESESKSEGDAEDKDKSDSEGSQTRSRCRSSVAPSDVDESSATSETGSDSEPELPRVIRCNPVQPGKPRAKPKARGPKAKEKFWENIESNSNIAKDDVRTIPHPIILTVYVNGRACRALLDSGAYSDFISTSLVDNLALKRDILANPMTLQMAVQGSRSKINATTTVTFEYSTIKCKKLFDVANIASYDMILGTMFIWQHKIVLGMNPTRVAIGSNEPQKIEGEEVHTILGAMAQKYDVKDERDVGRRNLPIRLAK